MLPKISIITVCYNAETLIGHTIQSVLNQTYANIEYIIVDGNSTDKTLDIVHRHSERSEESAGKQIPHGACTERSECVRDDIRIISESDTGIYDAMNKGLAMATGDYVWFMNAGDEIYEPTTIEKLIPYFEKNADVIYGDSVRIDENRDIIGLREKRPSKNFTWKSFRMGMTVCHQSILISRKIAPKYDLQYTVSADIDWVIRAMKQAKIVCNSHQILSRFLVGGFSQRGRKTALKERFAIMKKHYGLLETLLFHVFITFQFVFRKKS
ncbi:MAG: glycosyltransferase [Bacteroidales bacterium]|nr:glycosyltransferase [Bacteroidales bacterium]